MPDLPDNPARRIETRGRPRVRVKVQCGVCPAQFEARPSEIARGGARYCSAECRNQARSQGIVALASGKATRQQGKIELRCEVCFVQFRVFPHRAPGTHRQARYCSEVCAKAPPILKPPRR